MIKRRTNLYILLFVPLIYFCSNKGLEWNLSQWEEETIEFIEDSCSIVLNTITLGKEDVEIVEEDKIYGSVKEYLINILDSRLNLYSAIQQSEVSLKNGFSIWESYSRGLSKIQIITLDSQAYNLYNSTGVDYGFVIEEIPIESIKHFFDETLQEGETNCFHNFSTVPVRIQIFSKYDVQLRKFVVYRVSLEG